jgi:hypothetical protein
LRAAAPQACSWERRLWQCAGELSCQTSSFYFTFRMKCWNSLQIQIQIQKLYCQIKNTFKWKISFWSKSCLTSFSYAWIRNQHFIL